MPRSASPRHQRRAKVARARATSAARGVRAQPQPQARRRLVLLIGVLVVLATVGVAVWLLAGQSSGAPLVPAALVAPVAATAPRT